MDFLEIRKKAKELRARGEAAAPAPTPVAPGPPPAPVAGPPGVVTEEDLLHGALAARLQGLPPAEASAAQGDGTLFTTWRPGSGAPPVVPEAPSPAGPAEHPGREEDFAVVAPGTLAAPAAAALPARSLAGAAADPLDDFFYRPDEAGPPMPALAPAAVQEEAPAAVAREEYLTFRLGDEEYAVAIERVGEVIKAPPVTEVPRAPSHILGVVTVRGEVVAVVDPRRRLGLPPGPAGDRGKIVIVDAGEGPCGLLVDRVTSVVRLRPGSIEPCPQGIAGQRSEYLAGIGREGERLFTVLDVGALLRRAPAREGPRRADGGV